MSNFKPGDEVVYLYAGKYRPGILVELNNDISYLTLWKIEKPGTRKKYVYIIEKNIMLRDVYLSPLREALKEE